jgi:hypothetical protein
LSPVFLLVFRVFLEECWFLFVKLLLLLHLFLQLLLLLRH